MFSRVVSSQGCGIRFRSPPKKERFGGKLIVTVRYKGRLLLFRCPGQKVSACNKFQSTYPKISACSFLGINYYEEASNKFQEYLSEALIPERCCLLNDVSYPLETIDSFYWAPWESVEYDRDFLSKDADKVDERILKCCNNVPSLYEIENSIILDEDVLPKSEDLLDDVNFSKLNLKELHEELINRIDNFSFLEVPVIPFHLKKINTPLIDLLKNIPLMEVEDIFEQTSNLTFEDLEATFTCDTETNEKSKLFDSEGKFEEMILPMIPDEDINYEHLTVDCKKGCFSLKSTTDWSNEASDSKLGTENKNSDNRNFTTHFHQKPSSLNCQDNRQISHMSTPFDEEIFHTAINRHVNENFLFEENKQPTIADSNTSDSISKLDIYETSGQATPNSQFYYEKDTSISSLKTSEEANDNLLDLCSDDFFAEKFLNFESSDDEGIDDQSAFSDNAILEAHILNSKVNNSFDSDLKNAEIQQNRTTKGFLEKLAELDLTKTNELFDIKVSVTKENAKCTVKRFSASRDKSLMSEMPSCENFRNETNIAEELPCKSQNLKSFNLLSSFLYSRKKESGIIWSSQSSPNYSSINTNSGVEHVKNINNFKNVEDGNPSISNDNIQKFSKSSTIESIPCLKNEEIMVKLPDNYVEVIQMYETASIYYIQKLFPWEGFQFSSDLTIVDISLDKTRFLLNQEIKNCRDRNIGPLEGGVQYSHYIQLLILHGILKSMNCFIHFGAELSISSLYDFEKKHVTALKGRFQHLISEIIKFTEKSSITDAVHPKIKDLCSYLQSKYYFCKDNDILFKVLIVVKDYLKFFHSSFEAFMKTLLPELSIDLIPESCYLQQETDIFSGNEDHIYTVSVSSLSKYILLKNLTLFIDYEKENSVHWTSACNLENIAYSCMKFHPIPLKSLEEINCLPLHKDPFSQTLSESSKMPVIVLSSVDSKYRFLNSLDEKQNVSVYERSYMEYLPHMHFADVTIPQMAGIIIISMMSFLNGDFLDSIVDRLLGLHLKYEICWVIISDYLLDKNLNEEVLNKIRSGYYKLYCIAMNMKILQSFKIKFLYAENEGDVIKWINQIVSKILKITFNERGCYPKKSLPVEMSEEELFLISFPSLNPIVVAFILSERISLHDLMNLKLEELCSKFCYIPQRFLKQFYRHIQEVVNYGSNSHAVIKERKIERAQMPSENPCCSKIKEFQLQINPNLEEVKNFIDCIEKYKTSCDDYIDDDFDSELTQMFDYPSTPFNNPSDNYFDMTAEEIDRNYRSLQLQDLESASFGVDFETSSPASGTASFKLVNNMSPFSSQSNLCSPPPKKRKHSYNQCVESYGAHHTELQPYSLNVKSCDASNANQISKYYHVPNVSSHFQNKNMLIKADMNASQISKYSQVPSVSSHSQGKNMLVKPDLKLCNTLYSEDESLDILKTAVKGLNLSQYTYKNKRKLLPDFSNSQKSLKFSNQSSLLCSSSRIQKGQSSQTVCKQTLFKNIGETQNFQITEGSSQFHQSSGLPQTSASQLHSSGNRTEEFRDPVGVSCIEKVDSFWMSQGSVALTPKQNHRLSYERIPGKKGQTRLVFQ